MFRLIYFIIIVFVCCFYSCSKNKNIKVLTDEEFIDIIPHENDEDGNVRASIQKIDSLITYGDYPPHRKALLFNDKARQLIHINKHIEAIASLKKALYLHNEKSKKKYIANTYNYLSNSYTATYTLDSAKIYAQKAYKTFKEINHKHGQGISLKSLGHIAFQIKDYKTSAIHVKKTIELLKTIDDDQFSLASAYDNLGFILEHTQDYDQALEYYKKADATYKKNNHLASSPLNNLGFVYLFKNDIQNSKLAYKEALLIAEKKENHIAQKDIYNGLLNVAIKEKKIPDIELIIHKRDSINELLVAFQNKETTKLLNTKHNQFITQEKLKQELNLNKKNRIILGTLFGCFLAFCLYIFQRNRISNLLLKQQTLELEQKMLRIQMNPHFIFNTLTAIQNKIFDNEPLKQMTYISKFAKLIRQNFDFVNQKKIPLTEDIDALKNYIETQQFRFNNKFDYVINIDKSIDTDEVKIPPMLLQIFVENAIEHGLKPKTEQGFLTININTQKEFIQFKIIDNGIGYKASTTTKEHATDVFKKRLKLRKLGEEKLFSIKSLGNNLGTEVIFSLNLAS